MTQQIHMRAEAAALGLAKYWTGEACKRGHLDFRYTVSGACVSCVAGYRQKFSTAKNTATLARARGTVPFTAFVHPEDTPAVQQLVDALALARSFVP